MYARIILHRATSCPGAPCAVAALARAGPPGGPSSLQPNASFRKPLRRLLRRGRSRDGDEIEDTRAAVALDDAVVAAGLVEHLGPEADVAHGTEAVARLGHRLSFAAVRDAIENRQRFPADLRGDAGPLPGDPLQVGSGSRPLGLQRLPVPC